MDMISLTIADASFPCWADTAWELLDGDAHNSFLLWSWQVGAGGTAVTAWCAEYGLTLLPSLLYVFLVLTLLYVRPIFHFSIIVMINSQSQGCASCTPHIGMGLALCISPLWNPTGLAPLLLEDESISMPHLRITIVLCAAQPPIHGSYIAIT
jgi:hypothetical protein